MDKINTYKKILYHYQNQYNEANEKSYQSICTAFTEKNTKYKLDSVYGDYEQKFNYLHGLVLEEGDNIELLYDLIAKSGYHFHHTVLEGIRDICSTENEKTEAVWTERLLHSPYIYHISKKDSYYFMDTILGKIQFQKAPAYLENLGYDDLAVLAREKTLEGFCHGSTEKIVQEIPDSTALTTLCTAGFRGTFYHSFTLYENNCIDLNYNCVIPFALYKNLQNLKIVSSVSHHRIQKTLAYLYRQQAPSPLLFHALQTQAESFAPYTLKK